MIERWIADLSAWCHTVSPGFAFLLALPFVVGALGLIGDLVRRRCASRHGRG